MSSVLFITMAVYAGLCLSLYVFQSRLIFFRQRRCRQHPRPSGSAMKRSVCGQAKTPKFMPGTSPTRRPI
ncbi:MAG: hypothetical protein CMO26_12875 [Thiotrichales bacterium]|nr:hypothetical protein [Thiotrichales bacterium]